MHGSVSRDAERPGPLPGGARRMMWLNSDRGLYVGLLGAPSGRCFGAHLLYTSLAGTHCLRMLGGEHGGKHGDVWQEATCSLVPAWVPHTIESSERMICTLAVEAETVGESSWPPALRRVLARGGGVVAESAVWARVRVAVQALGADALRAQHADNAALDTAFLGEPLPARALDPRVQAVLARIKAQPCAQVTARECAQSVHLSVSRFLHLFTAEVGVPFRRFRAWQRARSLMYYVTRPGSLTDVALDAGYPDSSHFSHSIRRIYGLTPRAIFAGSRKLTVYAGGLARAVR